MASEKFGTPPIFRRIAAVDSASFDSGAGIRDRNGTIVDNVLFHGGARTGLKTSGQAHSWGFLQESRRVWYLPGVCITVVTEYNGQ